MNRYFIFIFSIAVLWSCNSTKKVTTSNQSIVAPPQVPAVHSPTKSTYWQQHVDYTMEVDMNVKNFRYTGTQELVYTNNSPDTLHRVFYHLYFNAFQPGTFTALAVSLVFIYRGKRGGNGDAIPFQAIKNKFIFWVQKMGQVCAHDHLVDKGV